MTNFEKLKHLSCEQLTKLIIRKTTNYNYSDCNCFDDYVEYWTFLTLDGEESERYMDESDAVKACIDYLSEDTNSKHN